jgi:ESCRT-II complex subunit VPS22
MSILQDALKKKATEIQTAEIGQMKEYLEVLKNNLEEFAKKYKKEINKNPEFRKHFADMCTKIGVDPLACNHSFSIGVNHYFAANKGFWAEMLGVGDFYYELAVQIIEGSWISLIYPTLSSACARTRGRNGGLIEINELRNYLEKTRGRNAQQISA